LKAKAAAAAASSPTTTTTSAGYQLSPVTSMYDDYDTATFGRPLLTEAEMEAVETGGASLFG
jgi:hypothetical protein